MKPADLNFSDIKEGDTFTFSKKISKDDVMTFAKLTGDFNPLHTDEEFGKKSRFNKNIAHGMLAGSLFSTIVGMYCPGKKCLYLSQTLNFKLPIFYDDTILVKGKVMSKNDSIKVIKIKTEIIKENSIVIDGEAIVKVLDD